MYGKEKKEYEQEFKKLYKEFLKGEKDIKDIIEENQSTLDFFQQDFNLDNKSIDFLPAFFNFIECYLEARNLPEVKKYLIVGLSNLMFSSKKNDETKDGDQVDEEDEELMKEKKNMRSRLDLLFARFNLEIKKHDEANDKLTNSIVLYAEIYGPESVGLTPHYYYLANYFTEKPFDKDERHEKREIIIRNVYLKIADIWKKYFLGEKYELFEWEDVDHNLNLVVGEYYVRKVISRIRANFTNDKELELKFKMIRVLILKELGSELYKETLNSVIKLKEAYNIGDRSFVEELSDKLS
jgi:hypothetical protein